MPGDRVLFEDASDEARDVGGKLRVNHATPPLYTVYKTGRFWPL